MKGAYNLAGEMNWRGEYVKNQHTNCQRGSRPSHYFEPGDHPGLP